MPAAVTGPGERPAEVDVLTVGEAMAVFCPDPPAPLTSAPTLRIAVAGAECNVAVHLAHLGLRVAYASRVGDDPFGALIRDHLTGAGVHATLDVDPSRPTGVYVKDPGPDGTRVHYYRAGSAASALDATIWAPAPKARLVHLSGITPALSASAAAAIDAALDRRATGDALISFDVNHRSRLWPAHEAAGPMRALANRADLVLVGLDEARALWGTETAEDVRAILPDPAELVVKDGAVGATSFGPHGTAFEPAVPVRVVEPVGAGDAFAAGYLYGVLAACPPARRLRFGHHLAGHALRTTADIGVPVTAAGLLASVPDHESTSDTWPSPRVAGTTSGGVP